jgi:hypothetical protein
LLGRNDAFRLIGWRPSDVVILSLDIVAIFRIVVRSLFIIVLFLIIGADLASARFGFTLGFVST